MLNVMPRIELLIRYHLFACPPRTSYLPDKSCQIARSERIPSGRNHEECCDIKTLFVAPTDLWAKHEIRESSLENPCHTGCPIRSGQC